MNPRVGDRRELPDGTVLRFVGYFLPNVRMVFATPTRGREEAFTPVWAVEEQR